MSFKGLREFIAKMEEEGEAVRIKKEVDWNLDVGAMMRRSNEVGLPAPFFQKVKGFSPDYRIFGSLLANYKRVAIAMDMDPNTHVKELIEEYLKRKQQPIKSLLVKDGPCKENIHVGEDVNLLEFPVPLVHHSDGGRYIGTWHVTVTKDPDSDWVNWGMYRHMLHDKNTIGLQAGPPTHIMRIHQKWLAKKKPMEIAIAIGVDPVINLCAASPIPYGVSEADVAGGIRGEAVELVKCETVDLTVPASAEIVIEGELVPGKLIDEGPFGEFTGYVGGHRAPRPVIHIKAITHRNNPIFTMSCLGVPAADGCVIASVVRAGEYLEALRAQGLPVTSVSLPHEGAEFLAIVAVEGPFARADQIAHALWATRIGLSAHYLIVVEDDVDPFNLEEVIHALVTRCHPYKGITKLEGSILSALVPWASRDEQKYLQGGRVLFNCIWPPNWEPSDIPIKCSFENEKIYPLEVQKKALDNWREYGY